MNEPLVAAEPAAVAPEDSTELQRLLAEASADEERRLQDLEARVRKLAGKPEPVSLRQPAPAPGRIELAAPTPAPEPPAPEPPVAEAPAEPAPAAPASAPSAGEAPTYDTERFSLEVPEASPSGQDRVAAALASAQQALAEMCGEEPLLEPLPERPAPVSRGEEEHSRLFAELTLEDQAWGEPAETEVEDYETACRLLSRSGRHLRRLERQLEALNGGSPEEAPPASSAPEPAPEPVRRPQPALAPPPAERVPSGSAVSDRSPSAAHARAELLAGRAERFELERAFGGEAAQDPFLKRLARGQLAMLDLLEDLNARVAGLEAGGDEEPARVHAAEARAERAEALVAEAARQLAARSKRLDAVLEAVVRLQDAQRRSPARAAGARAPGERAPSERATSERATSERATSERAAGERASAPRPPAGARAVPPPPGNSKTQRLLRLLSAEPDPPEPPRLVPPTPAPAAGDRRRALHRKLLAMSTQHQALAEAHARLLEQLLAMLEEGEHL